MPIESSRGVRLCLQNKGCNNVTLYYNTRLQTTAVNYTLCVLQSVFTRTVFTVYAWNMGVITSMSSHVKSCHVCFASIGCEDDCVCMLLRLVISVCLYVECVNEQDKN